MPENFRPATPLELFTEVLQEHRELQSISERGMDDVRTAVRTITSHLPRVIFSGQ